MFLPCKLLTSLFLENVTSLKKKKKIRCSERTRCMNCKPHWKGQDLIHYYRRDVECSVSGLDFSHFNAIVKTKTTWTTTTTTTTTTTPPPLCGVHQGNDGHSFWIQVFRVWSWRGPASGCFAFSDDGDDDERSGQRRLAWWICVNSVTLGRPNAPHCSKVWEISTS